MMDNKKENVNTLEAFRALKEQIKNERFRELSKDESAEEHYAKIEQLENELEGRRFNFYFCTIKNTIYLIPCDLATNDKKAAILAAQKFVQETGSFCKIFHVLVESIYYAPTQYVVTIPDEPKAETLENHKKCLARRTAYIFAVLKKDIVFPDRMIFHSIVIMSDSTPTVPVSDIYTILSEVEGIDYGDAVEKAESIVLSMIEREWLPSRVAKRFLSKVDLPSDGEQDRYNRHLEIYYSEEGWKERDQKAKRDLGALEKARKFLRGFPI